MQVMHYEYILISLLHEYIPEVLLDLKNMTLAQGEHHEASLSAVILNNQFSTVSDNSVRYTKIIQQLCFQNNAFHIELDNGKVLPPL